MRIRPYQAEAVKELLDKKRILVADEMGLGKTSASIIGKTGIELRNGRDISALIACPLSVVEHWEAETQKWYKYGKETTTVHLTTQEFEDRMEQARNADFVILDYPALSRLDKHSLQRISGLGFGYGIIDEGHNAKNPDALRTISANNLFSRMPYIMILTGTPMPNSVEDIYALMHLLDPQKFPLDSHDPQSFVRGFFTTFRRDPEAVRTLLGQRMLRRTVRDYMNEEVPKLEQTVTEVELAGDHQRVYEAIFERAFSRQNEAGTKLIQLQKAVLDPKLVDPKYLPRSLAARQTNMESYVYERVDELLAEVSRRKGKAIIFSKFKDGVTNELAVRWAEYGPVIVDSDDVRRPIEDYDSSQIGISKREFLRRKFQRDPKTKLMIATTVVNEGVDLTAATDVIHLGLPYTPAEFDQRNRRSWRFGEVQKEIVRSHILKTSLPYGRPTIDQGLEEMIEDKRRMTTYLLEQPFKLTTADWQELRQRRITRSKHLRSFLKKGDN